MSDLARRPMTRELASPAPAWREALPREDDMLDARQLVQALRKRFWQIVAIALLVLIPTVIATLLQQKLYRATAVIQIDPEPLQLLPNANVDTPRPAFEVFMRTQEQVLQGATLQRRVIERLRNDNDAALAQEASVLYRRYSVFRVEGTQMLRVSYLAPHPEVAAQIANLFTEEFTKLQFEAQQTAREHARQLLERDLRKVEDQIQGLERELVNYAEQHGRDGARLDRRELANQRLTTLAAQTLDAEAGVASTRARVAALASASSAQFPDTLVTGVLESRMQTVLQLEHELSALRTSFGENWPDVMRKREEIAVVREQLEREKQVVLSQARAQAAIELRAAEEKLTSLAAAKSEQEERLNTLQGSAVQYNILQRNVETNRKLHEGLLERLKQISVAPGIDLGSIRVIEPAVPDHALVRPRIAWNTMLGAMLGLALGISFALARDYWTNSLSTIEEVEQVTVLPVLASVPLVRASTRRLSSVSAALRLGRHTGDRRSTSLRARGAAADAVPNLSDFGLERSEAIRALCASLRLSTAERPPRVVVVTSALPGEGKTTIAAHLGRELAESGARTLLVEGDMRRPELSRRFGISAEDQDGLSLFLAGGTPQVAVHETGTERLFVVPAGPIPPNPMALLSSERLRGFIGEVAGAFHFVIIDTPPLLPIADARLFGASSDGVVLVVRAGQASKSLLRRACSLLDHSGCTVLGAVFNGVDQRDAYTPYYSYYQSTSPNG